MKNGMIEETGYRQWVVPEPSAVLLLVHGLGAHAGRWEAMADFFRKRGISSYAVELRSFDPKIKSKEDQDRFDNYYQKILGLCEIASKNNPSKKIFLIGESMGALISFLLCASRPALFSGVICISPAFSSRYKPAPLEMIRMLGPLFYDPQKQFKLPFDSSMCTRDIDYRNRMDRDPREYRSFSAKLIFNILLAQVRANILKKQVAGPVLFLLAGDDKIVEPEAAKAIFDALAAKDKTLVEFPGMYHSLSIELGKESVFTEILRWVEKRIAQ